MTVHHSIAIQRSLQRLDYYYQAINATILSKQNAVSGLMPASVAITVCTKLYKGKRLDNITKKNGMNYIYIMVCCIMI